MCIRLGLGAGKRGNGILITLIQQLWVPGGGGMSGFIKDHALLRTVFCFLLNCLAKIAYTVSNELGNNPANSFIPGNLNTLTWALNPTELC